MPCFPGSRRLVWFFAAACVVAAIAYVNAARPAPQTSAVDPAPQPWDAFRADLSEGDRQGKFAGHSLRAGLASSAEVDERYVQKQLGHASAEQTRGYQRRRDRFRVNLTKAAGL